MGDSMFGAPDPRRQMMAQRLGGPAPGPGPVIAAQAPGVPDFGTVAGMSDPFGKLPDIVRAYQQSAAQQEARRKAADDAARNAAVQNSGWAKPGLPGTDGGSG